MLISCVNLIYFSFLRRGIANLQYHKVGKERKTYNRFIFLDNSQKEKQTQNYCTRNEKLQLCLINAKKKIKDVVGFHFMLNVKDYCLIYIIHFYSKYINLVFQINYFVKMGDFLTKNIPNFFSIFFTK
jgi:hypothetical protein